MFALWLLSQTLAFALPALSSVAERESPTCAAFEQCQAENDKIVYDGCSLSCLAYDAEFPFATTQGSNDPFGTVPTIPGYVSGSNPSTRIAGAPRAPPVAEVGFVAAESGVRRLGATARGTTIENRLAATEYSGWFRAGQLDNGTFPLIDFQKGNKLVSLKTVDTTGSTWLGRMQGHIDDSATSGATVNSNPANMILDIRVQPGGAGAAQQLIGYGQRQGVTVVVKEFP